MKIWDQKNSDQENIQKNRLEERAARVCALLLGGAVLCTGVPCPAYAAQNAGLSESAPAENASAEEDAEPSAEDGNTADSEIVPAEENTENPGTEDTGADTAENAAEGQTEAAEAEENTQVLLPGAGFSYAFAAKKVSLRDVEDNLYGSGLISAIRTGEKKNLSLNASAAENASAGEASDESGSTSSDEKEDNRTIAGTQLTPVQAREQSVVNAVSETQGIQIDNATATILSATAVTVVSDANIAVQLAQMVDRKKAQMQLDQGVISASEAEALLASAQGSSEEDGTDATISITGGGDGSDDGQTTQDAEGGSAATDSDGNELVVAQVNDFINVREDADTDSEIVGKLYNGSVAKVLGRTGNGWARIQSGDVTGYIREEYVATGDTAQQLADSVSTKQAVVTTETLRVRAAAQADSDVITLIGQGETLDILEEKDGWYKVETPDGEGYISSDFADVEEIYPEAVSREQEEAEEAAAEASRKAEEEAAKEASDAAASKTKKSGSKKSSGSKSSGSKSLNTYTGSSGSGSASGQAVANYALQFVGNPYVWGGTSLTNGADCSGFTMAVYANFGVSLPHYTGSQQQCGTAVNSLAEAQPGDLILYSGHVAIYLGNNQIVHASNPRYGITTGTATYRNIVAIRRIFN